MGSRGAGSLLILMLCTVSTAAPYSYHETFEGLPSGQPPPGWRDRRNADDPVIDGILDPVPSGYNSIPLGPAGSDSIGALSEGWVSREPEAPSFTTIGTTSLQLDFYADPFFVGGSFSFGSNMRYSDGSTVGIGGIFHVQSNRDRATGQRVFHVRDDAAPFKTFLAPGIWYTIEVIDRPGPNTDPLTGSPYLERCVSFFEQASFGAEGRTGKLISSVQYDYRSGVDQTIAGDQLSPYSIQLFAASPWYLDNIGVGPTITAVPEPASALIAIWALVPMFSRARWHRNQAATLHSAS